MTSVISSDLENQINELEDITPMPELSDDLWNRATDVMQQELTHGSLMAITLQEGDGVIVCHGSRDVYGVLILNCKTLHGQQMVSAQAEFIPSPKLRQADCEIICEVLDKLLARYVHDEQGAKLTVSLPADMLSNNPSLDRESSRLAGVVNSRSSLETLDRDYVVYRVK